MTRNEGANQDYFEKFLEEKFSRVFERLDIIDRKSDRRDLDVNMLDTTNKAEIHGVKVRVMAVETQIGNVRLLLKSGMWALGATGAAVTWALGVWGHVAAMVKDVAL